MMVVSYEKSEFKFEQVLIKAKILEFLMDSKYFAAPIKKVDYVLQSYGLINFLPHMLVDLWIFRVSLITGRT